MSEERRLEVLRAIVQDYVSSREPVGSRAIVERHGLAVSPATVRNDMAYLEDAGFITQPHTSAGRIPTDKGYRLFVDQLASIKPLTPAERRAIETFLGAAVDLDDVMERTARLLAQVTHQVAIIQYPSLQAAVLRHLELVPVGERHLLVVVITENGRVEQRTLEVAGPMPDLAPLRAALNGELGGRRITELADAAGKLAARVGDEDLGVVEEILRLLVETLHVDTEERIVLAGTANLARATVDFPRTVGPVLDALEEQVVMLRLMTEMARDEAVAVRIGAENAYDSLAEASLVATTYGPDDGHSATGALAVLGPTRMDYPGAMASVRAVARYVSQILNGR